MDKIGGIYQIKNQLNNHRYVGSSADVYKRYGHHKRSLRNGKHSNSHLQRVWDKYSIESFVFQFLLLCPEKDLIKYEQAYLDRGHCEYNIATCAEASARGAVRSEETRAKLSGENNHNYGKQPSAETRAKVGASTSITMKGKQNALGCIRSAETRAKMSKAKKGCIPWNKGKTKNN